MELRKTTVREAAEEVCSGRISAYRLIEMTLNNCAVLNEGLNIFNSIAGIDALEQAKAVDRQIADGERPPLAGIPVAVKDDICYGVLPTGFGSAAFREFFSPYTATVVERLMDKGAIVIGKTNLDEMSLGSTTLSSPSGPTLNPRDSDRLSGSAGAAAVATGVCMVALESDSGGALRQGASHCGVVGLRPTTGRVSRHGLNAFSSSFGQIGITAASGENINSVLKIISGFDENDASTARPGDEPPLQGDVPDSMDLKIGYPAAAFDYLEPALREVFEQARDEYAARGFRFIDLELNYLAEALQAYYVIALAETSSNHSRFDGIRFGETEKAGDLEALYSRSRSRILGREGRRSSVFGAFLLSKGNYDRYYRQALKVWSLVKREFAGALTKCDLLMLPAVKSLPRPVSGETELLDSWTDDLYCAPVSLSGLPAISLPAGQAGSLPVGLQLVGPPFSEEMLAAVCDRVVPEINIFPHGNV